MEYLSRIITILFHASAQTDQRLRFRCLDSVDLIPTSIRNSDVVANFCNREDCLSPTLLPNSEDRFFYVVAHLDKFSQG